MSGASLVSNYITGDHFVGTAMMGTSNDGTAVVDTDTKVFGTDNLFVVDASIHPDLVSPVICNSSRKHTNRYLAYWKHPGDCHGCC